jgi:ABC-type lipoprotein release transport system permease subunit
MLSIVLGIWSGLFIMAMTLGLNEQRMSGAVNTYLSHIQVHHPHFTEDYNKKFTLNDKYDLRKQLDTNSFIKAYSERLLINGMVATAKGNYGVQIFGISPKQEKKLTNVSQLLIDGTYFTKFKRNPIVIGKKLADKLGVKIKSKVVLNFQDADNNTIAQSFRVEGIFKSTSSIFDLGTLFIKYDDIAELTGLRGQIHEVAILCNKIEEVPILKNQIKSTNEVESWSEISPELGYAQQTMSSFIYIFMGIILIALAFGIINTMLMAILERKHEIGMLISVGMNKRKVFSMILMETIFLAMIATPVGMLLSYWSISYFGKKGIDLASVAQGLESLGIGSRIYTELPVDLYFMITLMTLLVALISAIIPARRALKLNPAEAVKVN